MNTHYTVEKNVLILISLLKAERNKKSHRFPWNHEHHVCGQSAERSFLPNVFSGGRALCGVHGLRLGGGKWRAGGDNLHWSHGVTKLYSRND